MKGKSSVCVIAEKGLVKQPSKYEPSQSNNNYVLMMDRNIAENQVQAENEYVVREMVTVDHENNDTFLLQVADEGELNNEFKVMVSNRSFKTVEEDQKYTLLTFKKPVSSQSNLMNQQILAQQLANLPLTDAEFMNKRLLEARNYFITAVQVNLHSIKVFINTTKNGKEDYNLGVTHSIEKMYVSQQLSGSKSGYLLVYGENAFTVFEVGEGLMPVQVETFVLPKAEYQVNDCLLFGKYIIAAVDSKFQPTDAEYNKVELLKLTFAGKVSQTMPVNYQVDEKLKSAGSLRVDKLIIVNQHLFMVSPSAVLFYADLKNFNRFVQLAKLRQDYLFSESAQAQITAYDAQNNPFAGPTVSVASAVGPSFNLNSVSINTASASLSLDSPNILVLTFTFLGLNEILQRPIELPCVLTVQMNQNELQTLLASAQIQQSGFINQYRVFDFTPARVNSAYVDVTGNLAVEVETADFYKYLLLQFSSYIVHRFGLWNRQLVQFQNGDLLKQFVDQEKEFADDEEGPTDIQMNDIPMMLFMKFLSIKVNQEQRLAICKKDNFLKAAKSIVVLQGLFAPFIVPRCECIQTDPANTLTNIVSPAVTIITRPLYSGKPSASQVETAKMSIQALYSGQDPLTQSPRTAYTLSKFIMAVENNRFDDAYSYVSQSESVEIWRSLATLCIKNGYVDLLKTCVSHLKSPMISLLLRTNQMADSGNDFSQAKMENQLHKNQELASILSIALAELPAGIALVSSKPILHSKIMQQTGLATYNLTDDVQRQTVGFNSITRKSNVYVLANRLYNLGDYQGANGCYSELFGQQKGDFYTQNAEQQLQVDENLKQRAQIKEEFESNGLQSAVQLAKKLNTKASLYASAQQVEAQAKASNKNTYFFEAAKMYQLAGCSSHAMKNALICENDELIYQIGSTSKNVRLSLLAAGYFAKKLNQDSEDDQSPLERALILYSCSGYTGQAVELCLQSNKLKELCGLLNDIIGTKRDQVNAENNGIEASKQRLKRANISQELLTKAGQTLIQTDKESVTLDDYNAFVRVGILALAHAKAVDQALYCISQNIIPITEDIADLLTPEDNQSSENQSIILTIGKLLFRAELYAAAVKKFISISNSYLALQSLIKLGDVQKIVKFAQMSRSKECFVAAANFLQTQNFRDNANLMNMIITFYSKANAVDFLVKFFTNCAREEIDVFNDYEKAMDALREAAKWIGKAIQAEAIPAEKLAKLEEEKKNIEANGKLINGFLHLVEYARNNLNGVDAAEVLGNNAKKLLQAVVQTEQCMVQVPHILAFLAEFHAQRGEGGRVVQFLQSMKQKGIDVKKYVEESVLLKYGPEAGIEVDDVQQHVEEQQVEYQEQREDQEEIQDEVPADIDIEL
ncbi:Intraflagellar_transport protein 140 [Hexamita inflata]|uniref:Intraflagellar transport protein 140 n=1 Tax=Hexamita inflata TaxID=28002 RepID=A0AA86NEA2_9EUKA|nr:Intraflagellar transport protein 140 [Hexamita inflata]